MPQRLGRRSAGSQVAALVARLSDDLLELEEDCFAGVASVFEEAVDPAARLFGAAWRRAKDDPKRLAADRRFADQIALLHGQVLAATHGWDASEGLVTDRLTAHEYAVQAGQQAFVRLLSEQTQFAASHAEDQAKVAARLFNPEPNRLPGNGGRGIWWRATSGLNASARDVSIRLASTTRMAAMQAFNDAGAGRG